MEFAVSCYLKPADFGPVNSSQLHHFSDASEAAYGSLFLPVWKITCCSFESYFASSFRALSHNRFCATSQDTQGRAGDASSLRIRVLVRQHVIASLCEERNYTFPDVFLPIELPYYKRAQVQIRGAMWKVLQILVVALQERWLPVHCWAVSLEVRRRLAWMSSRWRPGREDGLQGLSHLCFRVGTSFGWVLSSASSWHRLKKSVAWF